MSNQKINLPLIPVLEKGGADEKANAMREAIRNTPNTEFPRSLVFYIANDGDDSNDGLSPETPFKTPEIIMTLPYHNYSVLFKRGDVFRLQKDIFSRGHTTFSAYGEGPKPVLLGSVRDYADPTIWSLHEKDIWVLNLDTYEAGNIIFNNETYVGFRKVTYEELENDGDFTYDKENGKFYLKLSTGNPGEVFDNIEICGVPCAIRAWNVNNVEVDNLCIKYTSTMGVTAVDCRNVTVTNCEFAFIGGAYIGKYHNRYGNGVEFYYKSFNCKVQNCYFNQIFDAAVTIQGEGPEQTEFVSIYFDDNLIEHTSMNFEFWVNYNDKDGNRHEDGIMHDIRFCGNIVRGAGYGWSTPQRLCFSDQGVILSWSRVFKPGVIRAFYIMDNIFDCANCSYIYAGLPSDQPELYLRHNTYYQRENRDSHEHFTQIIRSLNLYAHNQEEFEFAIKHWDANPDLVKWLDY